MAAAARRPTARIRRPWAISARNGRLVSTSRAVGRRFETADPRVRRDDVPAEGVQPELVEGAPDDRCRRLGGPAAGQLALRRERDPGDPGAAVARRLADEHDRRVCVRVEVLDQACAAKPRPRSFAVEVVRLPDAGGRETVDERLGVYPDQRSQRTSSSIGLRGCVPRLESRSETESSAG